MIKNGKGGGNTKTGLVFEGKTDLSTFLSKQKGYRVTDNIVFYNDEKLQTCDFKRKQYQKLMAQLNIDVEYIYLLSNWFKNPKYKDVLDYIISVRCQYYFEYIPLTKLGLPVPDNAEEE